MYKRDFNQKVNPKGKAKRKVQVFTNKRKKDEPENVLIQKLQEKYSEINVDHIKSFADFPLSPQTLKGLKENDYTVPTEIQRDTIGLALQGKDVLGAAQTGSGKTLAFLIPLVEILYCKQWTKLDGIGALVITPTRELAYQIFETLKKIGKHHDFSAGLIIGGKDLKFERKRMDQCNIIICTPGRLLQHMDQNPLFNCDNMQILVLDEADRCLDMGFQNTMNAIIANLPPQRQTLLFSATQTKSVKDLARLSLKDPSYVSVHEHKEYSTPTGLKQNYVVCRPEDKTSVIWSFIKNHLKQKCIIFFASCKQVKYMYEIFCKLRPGISLCALYGTLHQLRRMQIYETFCQKQTAILFATDLAARGLDFPEVHWVVQADCPEDSATYIHRVGRTARYQRNGESLMLVLPSELAILEDLNERRIPIEKIEINPIYLNNPIRKIEAYLASTPSLKESAQRAVVSYAKSVFLMKNKKVFDIQKIDTEAYSKSLGLVVPPRIRFLQKLNAENAMKSAIAPITNDEKEADIPQTQQRTFQSTADSDDDDIFTVKRADHDIEIPENSEVIVETRKKKQKPQTRMAIAKKILRKKIAPNKKIVFNEDGEAIISATKEKQSEVAAKYESEDVGGIDIETAKLVLREEDKYDKQLFKEKVKAKHKEQKRKMKQKKLMKQEEDDFGSESEEEPDLSWLPDPDKIYGGEESASDDINSQEFKKEDTPKPKKLIKRKLEATGDDDSRDKRSKLKTPLSLNETEELAMMLLGKYN